MQYWIAVLCIAAVATARPHGGGENETPISEDLMDCLKAVHESAESGTLKTDLKDMIFSDDLDSIVARIQEEVDSVCSEAGQTEFTAFVDRHAASLEIVKKMWISIKDGMTEEEVEQVKTWVDEEDKHALKKFFKPLFMAEFKALSEDDQGTLMESFKEIGHMFMQGKKEFMKKNGKLIRRFMKECIETKEERTKIMTLAKDDDDTEFVAFITNKAKDCGLTEEETATIMDIANMMKMKHEEGEGGGHGHGGGPPQKKKKGGKRG